MYYGYPTQTSPIDDVVSSSEGTAIWVLVSLILAVIGGLVAYFVFIKPDKKTENKWLAWFKDYFNFHKMMIEDLLKTIYIIIAIFITLSSFSFIGSNFLGFLISLIVGNIIARICFESALMLVMIWKNTNEINKKLKK